MSIETLDGVLRAQRWTVVFSFKDICEVVIPNNLFETRWRMQALEQLPARYLIGMPMLQCHELRAAATAFEAGTEPAAVNPFVAHWHQTYIPERWQNYYQCVSCGLVNYGLTTQVMELLWENREICRHLPWQGEILRRRIAKDRKATDTQRRSRRRVENGVQVALLDCRIRNPRLGIVAFAQWLREKPTRCPAWRLFEETYLEYGTNVTDAAENSDISDYTHIMALPYVDAITLAGGERRTTAEPHPRG